MKKNIIIGVSVLVVIIIGIVTFLLLNRKEKVKEPTTKFDEVAIYTITLDINPSIKIELNKDKKVINVTALNDDAKEIDDKIKTIKEEENKNNNENNNNNNSGSVTPSVGRPTNAQDKSGAWCTYNRNKAYNDAFSYPEMIGTNRATEIGKNYVQNIDGAFTGIQNVSVIDDSRGSYCKTYAYWANSETTKYYVYIDSVTGEIVGTKSEAIPKPKITSEEAIQIGLNYFSNVDTSNCRIAPQVNYSEAYQGRMSYGFFMECNGVQYSARIDGITGEIFGVF